MRGLPASHYTEALKAFKRGAEELLEDFERRKGKRFEPLDDEIDYKDGLKKLTNRITDFEIYDTEYGYVVFSKNLYIFKPDLTGGRPPYFVKAPGVKEYPIKPMILDTWEEYPFVCEETHE